MSGGCPELCQMMGCYQIISKKQILLWLGISYSGHKHNSDYSEITIIDTVLDPVL